MVQFYLNIRGSRDLGVGLTLPRIAAANQNAAFQDGTTNQNGAFLAGFPAAAAERISERSWV